MQHVATVPRYLSAKYLGLRSRVRRTIRRLRAPRHFLAVYAIMQNEAHIIREWMDIHLREGVEHFFLLDHGSTDDWRDRVQDHIRAGRVTVRRLPAEGSMNDLRRIHADFALDGAEWLLLQDLDEFTYAPGPLSMTAYLRRLPAEVGQVTIPWICFGTNGNVEQPDHVVPACTRCEDIALRPSRSDKDFGWVAKSILRTRSLRELRVHIHGVAGRTIIPTDDAATEVQSHFWIPNIHAARLQEFRILQNHYIHQSLAFHRKKMERRGYWKETHNGQKSYTMEKFEREEPRLNAVENLQLFDRHRDYYAPARSPVPEAVVSEG